MHLDIIYLSITFFSFLIFIMVIILLIVKYYLSYSHIVNITINNKKKFKISSGNSLLFILNQLNIFLPSACGGNGTCLQCKCRVISGGGILLPTEEPYFSRKQKIDNWRLGCQVKVKKDINIIIPESILGIKKLKCIVKSNYNVSSFIKELILEIPKEESIEFIPGSYIQVYVPKNININYKNINITAHPKYHYDKPDKFESEWNKLNIWKYIMINKDNNITRAYSMANYPNEGKNIIILNVRISIPPLDKKNINPGICSSYIFSRRIGDKIDISGPYGDFFINNKSDSEMIYIGGGAGMAPIRSHILHLFYNEKTKRKISFWYGGRSVNELFYIQDFYKIENLFPNFKFYLVLSNPKHYDKWIIKKDINDKNGNGFIGFVHQSLMDNYLIYHKNPKNIEFYFCGPPLMNNSVIKMCKDIGVPKQNIRFDDFGQTNN